ncbi:MAG: EAL domain-containing protein [Hahellaceae bacterium]|nr:EAL domain-containing protein [Hahellaceae bacterium]MCP5169931.1 EAL domain-containing protein [Hahellaceae bacterium]
MYEAKKVQGSHYRFYDHVLESLAQEKVKLVSALQQAWNNREFILYYSPIYNTKAGQLTAAEAVLRWQSPERGLIDPSTMLHHIEETPLISQIGYWIMDESCQQFYQWREQGILPEHGWISIDISPTHFLSCHLVDDISSILSKYQMPAKYLRLELRESMLMREVAIAQLVKLKQLGISIAIDHFGTGYSSMSYLKTESVDALIIDRSYVINFFHCHESQSSTRAMIGMGKTLGKTVIAEGIDNEALAAAMRSLSCDYIQGTHLALPMLPGELAHHTHCNWH